MTRPATLLLLLGLGGCALAGATPPTVEVAAVELRGVGLLDQALAVSLCVSNPNTVALTFRRVRVGVDVSGAPLAAGVSDAAVSLPPLASVLVPFSVTTTTANLGPQLLGVLGTGGIDYRLHGSVQLAGVLPISIPFSRDGRLDLLTAGQRALADAAAPAGTRCGPAPVAAPVAL